MSLTARELSTADDPQLHALFQEVFRTSISDALLNWKYAEGRGQRHGVFSDEGRLLAHCGLTFRRALVEGAPRRVAQLGDLMATRSKPGGLTRGASVFHHLIAHVYDNVQDAQNPDAVTYGFPSGRAMRLGEQLGLAVSIGAMTELLLAPQPSQGWLGWRVQPVAQFDAGFERMANRLWQRMADSFRSEVLCVRDAEFLRYRYVQHPEQRYEAWRISNAWGQDRALIFGKRDGTVFEVMDVVAARPDISRALDALRRHAGVLPGIESFRVWLPDSHTSLFADLPGCASSELQFRLVVNYNSSGGNLNRFGGKWWLTGGDTDYR